MLTMQTKTTTDESDSRTLIDSHELARRLSMSHKWVEKNRYRITGAQRVGSRWRFNWSIIKQQLALGKNIII